MTSPPATVPNDRQTIPSMVLLTNRTLPSPSSVLTPPATAQPIAPPPVPRSVAIRGNDFAAGDRPQRPPDHPVDGALDESHAPIAQQRVDAASDGATHRTASRPEISSYPRK